MDITDLDTLLKSIAGRYLKVIRDNPEDTFKTRLKQETLDLIEATNKLNDFMRSRTFYLLTQYEKDLLYEQYRHMISYLQILGKRAAYYSIDLNIK